MDQMQTGTGIGVRYQRVERGFSLIELAVVIVVIGILIAIAVPVFAAIQRSAVEAAVKAAASNGARVVAEEVARGELVQAPLELSQRLPISGRGLSVVSVFAGSADGERSLRLRLQDLAVDPVTDVSLTLPETGRVTGANFCVEATSADFSHQMGPGCSEAPEEETGDPQFVVTLDTRLPGCRTPGVNVAALPGAEIVVEWQGQSKQVSDKVTLTPPVEPGEYRVTFTGRGATFTRTPTTGLARCLSSVDEWDAGFTNTANSAFRNASNLVSVTRPPSGITDMSSMFAAATSFNGPVAGWDLRGVKTTAEMFSEASSFNQPVSSWDTSSVESMRAMFYRASSFNQPLDGWDVSNVTTMAAMFSGASSFNQTLGSWQTSNVIHMGSMFEQASSFDQTIGSWNVSKVENMTRMFDGASAFNRPLDRWAVGQVLYFDAMFRDASSFNQDVSGWSVARSQSWVPFRVGSALSDEHTPERFRLG